MLEVDLAQLHVQLLGKEHRHGGVRPLAHFHLVHDERHAAVAVDPDERVGRKRLIPLERGQGEAEQQPASDRGAGLEERPAGDGVHGQAPLESAACLIAARMRG